MLEIKRSQQSYKSLETITYNMDNLSNKPIDDNAPVATVNLPEVEVVAKRYVANIGGKEYGFSSEEKKNAFVDKVNRLITDSLTNKKYGYNPKRNWYRTKIG